MLPDSMCMHLARLPVQNQHIPTAQPRAPAPTSTPTAGMAGMPMVPPGAMHGAGGTDKDTKTDTKRVTVPTVKNGAPVEGRITTPPPAPQVTKKFEGKPVATKRIIPPNSKSAEEDAGENPSRS